LIRSLVRKYISHPFFVFPEGVPPQNLQCVFQIDYPRSEQGSFEMGTNPQEFIHHCIRTKIRIDSIGMKAIHSWGNDGVRRRDTGATGRPASSVVASDPSTTPKGNTSNSIHRRFVSDYHLNWSAKDKEVVNRMEPRHPHPIKLHVVRSSWL